MKRIMRDFEITELGAVDRPAQEPAVAVLLKRADDNNKEPPMDLNKIASFDSFEAAVAALAAASGIPRSEAMSKCAHAYPELLQKYQQEGETIRKARGERFFTAEAAVPSYRGEDESATGEWNRLVGSVQVRDKVCRSIAMSRARVENPRLWSEAFGPDVEAAAMGKADDRRIVDPPQEGVIAAWDKLVREIASRDRCPMAVATQRARIERPALFNDLQRA